MISIVVIAKNEQDRLKTCLESIKWADEIVVLDNGSSDKTIEIAKKYTDKFFSFDGLDFASLRNKGMEKTTNDWVLYVDADERVLSDLKTEILEIIRSNQYSALAISRKNIIFGKEVSYGPYEKDWVIRLFKKSDFEQWMGKVHEYPKFKGKLGYTKNSLLHLTHRGVDQFMKKVMEWSAIEAKLRLMTNHPKMSKWRFIRIFLTETFNQGFKRKGFFSDTVGIIDSMLQVFHLYITYVRLWELQQPKPLNEVYDDIDKKLIENNFK